MEIGYPTLRTSGDYIDPGQMIIVLTLKEARELRDSIDSKFPRSRGGLVAEISDGITDAINKASRAGKAP